MECIATILALWSCIAFRISIREC